MRGPAPGASPLPVQLTRFVGRGREIAYLGELLRGHRLVTVTGAGGSGKTRLAVEAAAAFAGEAEWVDLTPVQDPARVAEQIAAALGVRQEAGVDLTPPLLDALGGRELLLVLDNCEHLLGPVAGVAEVLLQGCPSLRILATSREALGVAGEVAWLLPVLSLPGEEAASPEELAGSEAVELFVTRAREVQPSFTLGPDNAAAVAEICRRLDGLPLALELAAARVQVLAPEQIADRLHDRFRLLTTRSRAVLPRHRTLHEVIAWSHDQLEAPERQLLRGLSVFVGDFSLEAAEAICATGELAAEDVLDLLSTLVGKSLVVVETPHREARYRLLETVRQFGLERLREAGEEEEARRRHARFFVEEAAARERGAFCGGSDPAYLQWFDAEMGELRAAAEWLAHEPSGDDALRLAVPLEWFWFIRGRFPEGRRWLETALRSSPGATPLARGKAQAALALLAFSQGDIPAQRRAAQAAVEDLRNADAPASLAHALSILGVAEGFEGRVERSRALMEEAVELARTQDAMEMVSVLALKGSSGAPLGDWEMAREAWTESARLAREYGFPHSELHLGDALGRVALLHGELEEARAIYDRLLDIRVDNPWAHALVLQGLGCLAVLDGDAERGLELLGAAAATRARIGVVVRPDEAQVLDGLKARARDRLGPDASARAWDRGWEQDAAEVLEAARATGQAPPTQADLSVRALGPVQVAVAGTPLPPDSWSQGKPLELLLHLLCHPDGRTREQIGLVFWPDASAVQVKNSFHVLLHRLRKSLGNAAAVVVTDGRYRINPEWSVWFDAAVFEAEMSRLLKERKHASPQALEEVLELYRGHFLEEEAAGDWIFAVHDRLRRLYVDGLDLLADRLLEADDLSASARVLERLVAVEDLREDAHRRLMLCLSRMGQRDRALRQYDRLVTLLEEELDAEPEAATRELAERIRAG